jgi:hypothetical protein
MPRHAPSLAPSFEFDTYLVLDDYGTPRIYHETDQSEADRGTAMRDISRGQYKRPVRIISFNIAEGWSRDVTEDVAREMLDNASRAGETLTSAAAEFIVRATGARISRQRCWRGTEGLHHAPAGQQAARISSSLRSEQLSFVVLRH